MKFRIGEIYRYAREKDPDPATVDGLANYFFRTHLEGLPKPLLESGISPIGRISHPGTPKLDRTPAILISSSPHNRGSDWNPWQDDFEPDHGHIRYFGDNKGPGDPATAPGNRLLLSEFEKHNSGDRALREKAVPLVFFERIAADGRVKGNLKFAGFGVIERVELITQFNPKLGYFTNYVFDFAILSLSESEEFFEWEWINDRRNSKLELSATLEHAPVSWRRWLSLGNQALAQLRRKVHSLSIEPTTKQVPTPGSTESKVLLEIYEHYSNAGRHRFELLASRAVMSFINSNGGRYLEGWVTKGSGDGGIDFVGRVTLGLGFSAVDVIVLGQAKCEALDKPTSGKDLARTVARLKRGWIGAYVTTSFFSKNSQEEIIEDQYPLIKINGATLARETIKLRDQMGFNTTKDYLEALEAEYPNIVQIRRPEDMFGY